MADLWLRRGNVALDPPRGVEVADATTVRSWLRSPGRLLSRLARHARVRLVVPDADAFDHRCASLLAARLLSHGVVEIAAPGRRPRRVTGGEIAHAAATALRAAARAGALVAGVRRLARALHRRSGPPAWRSGGALYLRSDPWYGVRAGGSVAHIAGVLNALAKRLPGTRIATTDAIPTLAAAIPALPLPAPGAWRDERTLACLAANASHARALLRALATDPPALIYQRSSAFSLLGALCARRSGAPLVLEFNGSESWIARNWGTPLKRAALCDEIELAALRAADLVTAVSQPMCDDLLARGLEPRRVLCCPNGVDTATYRPDLQEAPLRRHLGWGGAVVVGFIGTCGPWHGVELLAESFILARASCPRLRLLLIGDGAALPAARRRLTEAGALGDAHLPGLVAQHEGPAWLAACDVLVNPTVPNPDGTPFFGSPTKLFEYLAMGRAVVASRLGQAAEVVDDGRSGLLFPPGDAAALAATLVRLAAEPALRADLGAAARAEAIAKHGWDARVALILARLRELCP